MCSFESFRRGATLLGLSAAALAQSTTLISHAPGGVPGNGACEELGLSSDGRYVTFVSWATNLVPGDTNGTADIFLRDRTTGQLERISLNSAGEQANGRSGDDGTSVSDDGRYVVFSSWATNLVSGDTNSHNDLFLRDRSTGQTRRISLSSTGQQVFGNSDDCVMSADGRFVACDSDAPQLWPGDANFEEDVIVFDLAAGLSICASVNPAGQSSNRESLKPAISADGRWVAFSSTGSDIVPGDTNDTWDIFLRDMVGAQTWRVSVSSSGAQANGPSDFWSVSLSADGRYVAFQSSASNLVSGDTNGVADVFLHDHLTAQTVRVSLDSADLQANGASERAMLSPDGRYLSFASSATNLVSGDTNGVRDIFVRDLLVGSTWRASVDSGGQQANGASSFSRISLGGALVAFQSAATNLVPGDTNSAADVFVRESTGCNGFATNYCLSAVNTTGQGAHIGWQGSTSLSANDFVLTVSDVPPGHPGAFFLGCYQTQIPFGEGWLCLTGQQRRLRPLVLSNGLGQASLALDFSDPLAPESVITLDVPWNFQLWYRDPQPVGHGFNLSDALSVQFCP